MFVCFTGLVNGLEGELERSKENLEQDIIMIERERFTQTQWDMEELRQKSYEMEMKLKSREVGFEIVLRNYFYNLTGFHRSYIISLY